MARKITPTHVLLNQIELSSSASSVTFSNIPQGYGDLVLTCTGTASSSVNGYIFFNEDSTGSNYSWVRFYGTGSSANSNSDTTTAIGYDIYTNLTTLRFNIQDYSASDKHTTVLSRWDTAQNITGATALRWENTNSISSITLDPSTASFNSGFIASLYGVYA